ncbi:AbrB/MazE/SpoVT family DNA-binding domain-containing protein [bacterium]|nr:AbrB/MazE/SpoVT family DNA-binding domain-containing protein [bacterium]MBU1064857.1 AbrB/MazE/SpoVT family DNA-binding domain-containing protein [bacterium]MBU1634241.1 AbrB/MazE/SpoVT family DNA-binding domain-containing protein [bacterium]MBU1873188.1 AbrB/MazE/SpoVT family DNA-binding domain-containing protein [bacterium]
MRRKIIRVGSSRGVLLPREVTKAMFWDFGTEVDLDVNSDRKEVTLKTIKVSLPEDYELEHLRGIEDQLMLHADVLGGIDD